MALPARLEKLFKENGVAYQTMVHSQVYTAQEIAAAQHVPGKMMTKAVMLKTKGRILMLVASANCRVDLERARQALGEDVALAAEHEFKDLFPDCEAGAMPPFGNLYGVDTYVGPQLRQNEQMVFNAGNHVETVKIKYADFERLVRPKDLDICTQP